MPFAGRTKWSLNFSIDTSRQINSCQLKDFWGVMNSDTSSKFYQITSVTSSTGKLSVGDILHVYDVHGMSRVYEVKKPIFGSEKTFEACGHKFDTLFIDTGDGGVTQESPGGHQEGSGAGTTRLNGQVILRSTAATSQETATVVSSRITLDGNVSKLPKNLSIGGGANESVFQETNSCRLVSVFQSDSGNVGSQERLGIGVLYTTEEEHTSTLDIYMDPPTGTSAPEGDTRIGEVPWDGDDTATLNGD